MATVILLSRRVQPAAFALTLACLTIGWTWLGYDRIPGYWEQVVGVGGLLIGGFLIAGWLAGSNRMLRYGLLGATGLWIYIACVAMHSLASPANWLLALAWAVLASGTYWLEEADHAATRRSRVTT